MRKKKITKILITAMVIVFGSTTIPIKANADVDNGVEHQYDLIKLQNNDGNRRNLITDSGFENTNNGTWKTTGDGSFSTYPNAASDGTGFGLLPANSGNAAVYQVVNVKPNTNYVVKAKILVAKDGASAFLNVKTPDVSSLINNAEKTVSYSSQYDWKYQNVELEFNSGDNTSIALCVMKWTEDNQSATFQSQVYVDEVYLEEANVDNDENYEFVWADDFNGSELDLSSWEYELGSIRGWEQQHYVNDSENVFVRSNDGGGELILRATDRPEELQYNNPRNELRKVIYNSGSVRTHGKKEFLYGRIEMRAKLPKGQSVFPAFWTLGSDFTIDGDISNSQGYGWARCGEIDIMELIGSDEGEVGNKTVYQTIHTSDGNDGNDHKLAGVSYTISEDFADDYHVFGINWSKGKMEWYVDDQIVKTVDYSNDPIATKCLDRPQYIQMNLAMGGAWPGEIQEGLSGTEYAIDYVYYAQNEQQKLDAEEYYQNAPKILSYDKDVIIYEGDTDILSNVLVSENSNIDFSITDAPKFSTKEDEATTETSLTSVDLLCQGKNDLEALAKLPSGEYTIYYTALSENLKLDTSNGNIPDAYENYKFDRKAANLKVKERSLETDLLNNNLSLDGYVNDTLETIELPDGWYWNEPDTVITKDMGEVSLTFSKNAFEKVEEVKINTYVSVALEDLIKIIEEANIYLNKPNMYTNETLLNLKNVVDNANVLLDSELSVTYRDITKAYEGIDNAIKNLVELDKSQLAYLINKAKVIDLSKYTEESANELKNQLAIANEVFVKEDTTQEEINEAVRLLNTALENLIAKGDTNGGTENNGDGSSTNGNNSNSTEITNDSNKTQNKESNNGGKLPSTGFENGYFGVVVALLSIVLGLGLMLRKPIH